MIYLLRDEYQKASKERRGIYPPSLSGYQGSAQLGTIGFQNMIDKMSKEKV